MITFRSPNSVQIYQKKSQRNVYFKGLQLTREEKVRFLFQSAFKVDRNNVKMLNIFWGPKMRCQNIVEGRYFQKKLFLFFCVIKFTFQFFNPVYFELFLKQSLMTIVFDLEI